MFKKKTIIIKKSKRIELNNFSLNEWSWRIFAKRISSLPLSCLWSETTFAVVKLTNDCDRWSCCYIYHCSVWRKKIQFADKIDFNNYRKRIFIWNTYLLFKWMVTSIEAVPDSPYSSIEFEWVFDANWMVLRMYVIKYGNLSHCEEWCV